MLSSRSYAVASRGLGTSSDAERERRHPEVAHVSQEPGPQTSGAVSSGRVQLTDRTVDSARGNSKQPLRS